jgi:hypothetical protein
MQHKLISEIFEELIPHDPEDQATILGTNNSLLLRQFLIAAYDPSVEFEVEIPIFRENEEVDGFSSNSLMIESRRLYIFLKGSKVGLPRRKEILAQILESIDPKDAQFLIRVIKKDMGEYNLTVETINMAFPDLIKIAKMKQLG